ncbi:MAG: hypothetical protein GX846_01955 [Deltaproteobacteria bacterium]|nr:hypothetical protein [Deltaproteobacteria bacterium]
MGGGVRWYAAQLTPQIDAEIAKNSRFWMETSYKYNSLSSKKKAELNEFTDTVLKYINEELKNHGINDRVDYYTRFIQDDELSKQVQRAVTDRLADNSRVMELMESFGISLF